MLNVSSVLNLNNIYFLTIFSLCSIIIHLLEHSILYLILAAAEKVRLNSSWPAKRRADRKQLYPSKQHKYNPDSPKN